MEVTRRGPVPKPLPPATYDITGLTEDEAVFLRDLMGIFADNPGDNGIDAHFHTSLYARLYELNLRPGYRGWTFTAAVSDTEGSMQGGVNCLHCKRGGY